MRTIAFFLLAIFFIPNQQLLAQERSELDSLYAVLRGASAQDSLDAIQRISQILPFDSAQYGFGLAKKGFAIAERLEDEKFKSHFVFYKALFHERLGELDQAIESYHKAQSLAYEQDDHLFSVNALLGIAVIHQKKGDYDQALMWLDTLRINAADHLESDSEIFLLHLRSLDLTGDSYYFKGDHDTAIAWYDQIIDVTSLEVHPELLANAYKGISAIYSTIGNLAESVDFGHKALEIFESLDNQSQVGRTLNELGRAYIGLGEMDKALDFYERSLTIKEGMGDRQGMTVVYQNIGIVHSRQKNYGLALDYYKKSLKIKEELGISRGMAALSINIGLTHKRQGEYAEAESYYFDAIKKAEAIGSTTNRDLAVRNMASLYLSWSKFNLARDWGKRAVEAGKAKNSKSALYISYYNLHEAYLWLGDHKQAYENYVLSMQYNDSLVQQRNASKIARIEQEYAKESEERQIELNDRQLSLLAAQQRLEDNQKGAILLGSIIVVILSALAIRHFILKSKREKQILEFERDRMDLNARLTAKDLENANLLNEHGKLQLSTLSKEIAAKNKKLSQLEDDLERLTKDYIADEAKERKGLAETVLSHGRNGEEWSRFMEYFQNVYKDFLDRLKNEYSSITANELRLCALIKINLSSKEIAYALNITPESLRTAKYRLRKKIALTNDEKLNDFLLKY